MQLKMKVVTRLQDNGDGGYTMWVYNSEEEMLRDHPKAQQKRWEKGKGSFTVELTEAEKREILFGDNEYENGYINDSYIKMDYDPKTKTIKLAEPLCFYGGQ